MLDGACNIKGTRYIGESDGAGFVEVSQDAAKGGSCHEIF